MKVEIIDKYKIEKPTFGQKLGCFFGFHFDTVAEKYKLDDTLIDKRKMNRDIERLRGSVRRCGSDLMYCRVCGHEWREKWSVF